MRTETADNIFLSSKFYLFKEKQQQQLKTKQKANKETRNTLFATKHKS